MYIEMTVDVVRLVYEWCVLLILCFIYVKVSRLLVLILGYILCTLSRFIRTENASIPSVYAPIYSIFTDLYFTFLLLLDCLIVFYGFWNGCMLVMWPHMLIQITTVF
jgi:hypothetical protein